MIESLTKENTSIPEIFYHDCIDVLKDGLMDIYVSESNFEDNRNRVTKTIKRNRAYIAEKFTDGLTKIKNLSDLPADFIGKIPSLSAEEIIEELEKIRGKMFNFSGYIEFTHTIGKIDVNLDENEIRQLGMLHEGRKAAYLKYFDFWDGIGKAIAKKAGIKFGNISYLVFTEIAGVLKGRLAPATADKLQIKRQEKCVAFYKDGKAKIYTGLDFDRKFKTIKVVEYFSDEVKGVSINKGIVRGEVKIISQKTLLNDIPSDKVIVIPMTNPYLTPILKKSRAVVTDEGGLLCHAANIAREFGIIAIIGTKVATKLLKDGDLVEVDADKGIVTILKKHE
jgi:phosphohistidine swiveling domain-containing protein